MRLKNTTAPLIVDSDEEELEIETIQLDQPTKTTGTSSREGGKEVLIVIRVRRVLQ